MTGLSVFPGRGKAPKHAWLPSRAFAFIFKRCPPLAFLQNVSVVRSEGSFPNCPWQHSWKWDVLGVHFLREAEPAVPLSGEGLVTPQRRGDSAALLFQHFPCQMIHRGPVLQGGSLERSTDARTFHFLPENISPNFCRNTIPDDYFKRACASVFI